MLSIRCHFACVCVCVYLCRVHSLAELVLSTSKLWCPVVRLFVFETMCSIVSKSNGLSICRLDVRVLFSNFFVLFLSHWLNNLMNNRWENWSYPMLHTKHQLLGCFDVSFCFARCFLAAKLLRTNFFVAKFAFSSIQLCDSRFLSSSCCLVFRFLFRSRYFRINRWNFFLVFLQFKTSNWCVWMRTKCGHY